MTELGITEHTKHLTRTCPVGWRRVRLEDVCEVRLGKMLSPASKIGRRTAPYLRNANVQWNRFDLTDIAEMDFSEVQEATLSLRPGDLLVCEGGEPGRAAVWEGQISRCCYQKALHRLRPINAAVDPYFVMYRLWLGALESEFTESNAKTTIAHLPVIRLKNLKLLIPPLEEQRRIAGVLSDQMTALEKARAAVQARLEASVALPGAFVRQTLGKGEQRRYILSDCLNEVRNGVGADWSKYPVLGATRDGLAPAKEGVGKAPARYKLVDPITVFYNPMRILLGSIAMIDDEDPAGITSPDYVVVKGRPGILDSRWFYFWFRSTHGAHLIDSLSRGAVRERILFNRLAAGKIQLPDYETQLLASERMKQVRPIVKSLNEELLAIDALAPAILRAAFAGRA